LHSRARPANAKHQHQSHQLIDVRGKSTSKWKEQKLRGSNIHQFGNLYLYLYLLYTTYNTPM
jgi:hypothetical protein